MYRITARRSGYLRGRARKKSLDARVRGCTSKRCTGLVVAAIFVLIPTIPCAFLPIRVMYRWERQAVMGSREVSEHLSILGREAIESSRLSRSTNLVVAQGKVDEVLGAGPTACQYGDRIKNAESRRHLRRARCHDKNEIKPVRSKSNVVRMVRVTRIDSEGCKRNLGLLLPHVVLFEGEWHSGRPIAVHLAQTLSKVQPCLSSTLHFQVSMYNYIVFS